MTYFVLSFHLRFQIRNESCFEILDALEIEAFQLFLDRLRNTVKLFLTAVNFGLPLERFSVQRTCQVEFGKKKSEKLRANISQSAYQIQASYLTSKTSSLAGATLSERPVDSHRSTASRFLANIC